LESVPLWAGFERLEAWLESSDGVRIHGRVGVPGFRGSDEELDHFPSKYQRRPWHPPKLSGRVRGYLGIDGGSASTKAVLIDEARSVLAKVYKLLKGNPIGDVIQLPTELDQQFQGPGAELEVLGAATTGYAKHILARAIGADVALVEAVAHARSGLALKPNADVILEVGGQDLKIIALKNGEVRDFMLNAQSSAGNGHFLQATARPFGVSADEYANREFQHARVQLRVRCLPAG